MTSLDQLGLDHGTDKASNGHNYLHVYEREIGGRLGHLDQGTLLELGWFDGASMRMWRDWLPLSWDVIGVDIEPKEPVPGVRFMLADQTSVSLLDELGPLDVIVDDASHISPLTVQSFRLLWPLVKPGGLYFIEDLQVSYHPDWAGWDETNPARALRPPRGTTSMQFLKRRADDVHAGHAGMGPAKPGYHDIAQVCFWPGLCMIRKAG